MPFHWTCVYCNRPTTLSDSDYQDDIMTLRKLYNNRFQAKMPMSYYPSLCVKHIVCPSPNCRKQSVSLCFNLLTEKNGRCEIVKSETHNVLPRSRAIQLPDYIPLQIRQDYEEAHLILELSPKASATLSRRCLQGMIRDFWGIVKNRLVDEVDALENEPKLDPMVLQALHAVRKIGNIGAHMEKDINLIIDVDPLEAKKLLELLELLFEEWYIHRYERESKINSLIDLDKEKDEQKQVGKSKA